MPGGQARAERMLKLLVNHSIAQKYDIFQIVKSVPFPEIQQLFDGQELGKGKILCPFHNEKTPSFQVYDDCGHCFGCGWHGDGIDFLAKLKGLKPIDAARIIAERFGLAVDRPPTQQEAKKRNELKRRRSISKMYKILEDRAYHNLISYRDTVNYIVDVIGLDDLDPATVKKVHKLPMVEEYLRILAIGSDEEKLQLLREGVLLKWAKIT